MNSRPLLRLCKCGAKIEPLESWPGDGGEICQLCWEAASSAAWWRAAEFKGVLISFSINCCSGVVHLLGEDERCECWRCREERGEAHNAKTEEIAAQKSKAASAAFRRLAIRKAGQAGGAA